MGLIHVHTARRLVKVRSVLDRLRRVESVWRSRCGNTIIDP